LAKHTAPKQLAQLKKVLRETRVMLHKIVTKGVIAVTSFRKGGVNADHGFLHQVQSCLISLQPSSSQHEIVDYVHFQSGFENSLFGWKGDGSECEYGNDKYYDLNMKASA
jgi:hypothetical protein